MSNTPTHGSDVQETPEWWMASDQRWYPPELHPDYKKPEPPAGATTPAASGAVDAASAAAPRSQESPSLAERLRSAADRVGDEAAAAADAGPGSMGDSARDALDAAGAGTIAAGAAGAAGSLGSAPGAVADAADDMVDSGISAVTPVADAVVPDPGVASGALETVIQQPATPPADPRATMPATPPSGSPVAPVPQPSIPQSPGDIRDVAPATPPTLSASAPAVEEGPMGITYTAPPEAAPPLPAADPSYQIPPAPGYGAAPGVPAPGGPPAGPAASIAGPAKATSPIAGVMAALAGAIAIAGSLLQWGKGDVTSATGVEKALIEVAGFDSNGLITAIMGGLLIVCGILFFMGVPRQLFWAIAAFVAGGVIVGAVVFSAIDIADLSDRYAAVWITTPEAADLDEIATQPDIGLFAAGAGGVLGVLAAPFARRD